MDRERGGFLKQYSALLWLCANAAGVRLPAPSPGRSPPPTTHLHPRETEAQGSDTAGGKATANYAGTEPRRHQIPGPRLTLDSTPPSEGRAGRLRTGWW